MEYRRGFALKLSIEECEPNNHTSLFVTYAKNMSAQELKHIRGFIDLTLSDDIRRKEIGYEN